MSKSIADGAKLTTETFADFVERLKYHHRGDGVNRHATADPIFMVQKQVTIYGLAEEYGEAKIVHFDECEWNSPKEYWDDAEDDKRDELNCMANDMWEKDFLDCEESEQWDFLADLDNHTVCGTRKEWQHVNAHLTREAAECYQRCKTDPPQRLKIDPGVNLLL
ncbi:hypothetical protein [Citrobacter sp. W9]|uniref:hypothetical protein n=1 Tax=Citrobacter sp. W9 TaxID=2998573 RepID=UPI00227B14ED|nr:hypothetical protein [Citrobacter sp. W9]